MPKLTKEQLQKEKERLSRDKEFRIQQKHLFDALGRQLVNSGCHSFNYDRLGRIQLSITDSIQVILTDRGEWSLV